MKTYFNFKSIVALFSGLLLSIQSFAQTVNEEAVITTVTAARPIYEKFGMTSTQLFILMVSFTILLVIVIVSISSSLNHVVDYSIKKKKSGGKGKAVLLLLSFMVASSSFGAEPIETPTMVIPFSDQAFWILFSFDLILLMVILYMVGVMQGIIFDIYPKKKTNRFWKKWQKVLVDATPIENEQSVLLDHDYDGIKELDNNLPPWWKYGFYITIVWAVCYISYYHILGGQLQEAEYLAEMEAGELAVAQYKADHPELVNIDNVQFLEDDATMNKGRSIFKEFCVTCHMDGGAGGAGPNLTDQNWIYNGDIKGVFNTISEGADNGMKAWKTQLNGAEIQAVASYVLQLDPLLPPLGQEPKGDNIYP